MNFETISLGVPMSDKMFNALKEYAGTDTLDVPITEKMTLAQVCRLAIAEFFAKVKREGAEQYLSLFNDEYPYIEEVWNKFYNNDRAKSLCCQVSVTVNRSMYGKIADFANEAQKRVSYDVSAAAIVRLAVREFFKNPVVTEKQEGTPIKRGQSRIEANITPQLTETADFSRPIIGVDKKNFGEQFIENVWRF